MNNSTRKQVVCAYGVCAFEACKSCIRTYIMNSYNDPHCMSCKHPYTDEFMVANLNRSFVKSEYKVHREELLFQYEKSRLPETMAQARDESDARQLDGKVKSISLEIDDMKRRLNVLELQKRGYDRERVQLRTNASSDVAERKKFVMPCSNSECNGFLSTSYKCDLCKSHTCKDCLEFIGEYENFNTHTCDANMVKTANLIKSTTKPCPCCGERIQKIDGCDQMWCSTCKNAFSWNTGQIDHGPVHNPHFYEYLRMNNRVDENPPRNPGDVVCGGIPPYLLRNVTRSTFKNWVQEKASQSMSHYSYMLIVIRIITHVSHVTLLDYRRERDALRDNTSLRVKFILKDISHVQFKKEIYKRDTLRKRNGELCSIWELFTNVGIDLLRELDVLLGEAYVKQQQGSFHTVWDNMCNLLENFERMIEYFNTIMKKISMLYNIKTLRYRSDVHKSVLVATNVLG